MVFTELLSRKYANATTVKFADIALVENIKGKIHATYKREYASYTFGGTRDYIDHIFKLKLDETDFAVKLETTAGNIPIEFSLSTPEIKKVLTDCGFQYDERTDSAEEISGLDLDVSAGTALTAVAKGTVSWAGERAGYGVMVEINHGNGLMTRFNYNTRVLVRQGDRVLKGQTIAIAGSVVHSKGRHRRFEILKDGVQIDPLKFIAEGR